MIEEELSARLAGRAELAALIGAAIYPEDAPPDTALPFVIYHRDDTQADDTLNASEGLPEARFTLDAFAATLAAAKAIAEQIKASLDGWTGDPPALIFCAYVSDEYSARDKDARAFVASTEITVKHRKG